MTLPVQSVCDSTVMVNPLDEGTSDGYPFFSTDVTSTLDTLFELQDEMYKAGARNFLLVNVPPLPKQRSMGLNVKNSLAVMLVDSIKYYLFSL